MSEPTQPIETRRPNPDARTDDSGLKPYAIVWPERGDRDDRHIYAVMCAKIAQDNGLQMSQTRFDGIVDGLIENMRQNGKPLITPPIEPDTLRKRGEFMQDGQRIVGYEMAISVEMQRDFLHAAKLMMQEKETPQLSEEYKQRLGELDRDAASMQEKLAAVDRWYQGKNTRHGLGDAFDFYLERAGNDALALQNARNDAKNPNLMNSETRLTTAMRDADQRLTELFPDYRKLTPEQMVKRLDDYYEAGFKNAKVAADIVGKIPGPVGAVGEFGINQIANGLRWYSGDITNNQALLETVKDGAKLGANLLVKSGRNSEKVDQAVEFVGDAISNVAKRMAEAEKQLKDNPKLDRAETMRAAILHGAGDTVLNTVGKNLKMDKYGFSAGGEAVKDFGVNLTKNLVEEYRNANKQLAKEERLDATQLYKEGAVKALVNATSETMGKSVKSLAGDDKAREFMIEVAKKLGVDEPLKQYLDSQKSLAKPDAVPPDPKRVSQSTAPAADTPAERYRGTTEPGPTQRKLEAAIARLEGPELPAEGDGRRNLSAALTLAATRAGLNGIDDVMTSRDGTRLIAVQGDTQSEFHKTASVAIRDAMREPAERSETLIADAVRQQQTPPVSTRENEVRNGPTLA